MAAKDHIIKASADSIVWQSETRGDYDGLKIKVDDLSATFTLSLAAQEISTFASSAGFGISGRDKKQHTFNLIPAEIPQAGKQIQFTASDFITILRGESPRQKLTIDYTDTAFTQPDNYYYIRVTQVDGEMAWSSPIWVQTPLK